MSLTRSRFCRVSSILRSACLLALLVLGDAGGLFDEQAAVFRARADDQADPALLDDRVRLGADAGAEEELGDVLQADLRLVDQVLARAVAVEAARDRDLRVVLVLGRQRLGVLRIGVVEGERDLGHAVRTARLGAVEDDVFHRAAAQVLRALLAHATSGWRRRCSTCRSRSDRRCR